MLTWCFCSLQAPSLHQELQKQLASQAALSGAPAAGPAKPVSSSKEVILLLHTQVIAVSLSTFPFWITEVRSGSLSHLILARLIEKNTIFACKFYTLSNSNIVELGPRQTALPRVLIPRGLLWFLRQQRRKRTATSNTMLWAGWCWQLAWSHGWAWLSLICHHLLLLRPWNRFTSASDITFSEFGWGVK